MTKKDTLIAGVKRVGRLLAVAAKSKKTLSAIQLKDASSILANAKMALRREKYLNAKAVIACNTQRKSIQASVKDASLSPADSRKSLAKAVTQASKLSSEAKRITSAIASLNNLSSDLRRYAGEESQTYKDDKGHGSDSAIPAPQKADPVGADATGGSAPMVPAEAPPLDVKDKAQGAPTGADGAIEGGTVTGTKAQAQKLYAQAIKLVKESAKETDAKKKASLARRASIIEKHADKLIAGKVPGVQDGTGPYGMKGDNPATGRQKGDCSKDVKEKAKKKVKSSVNSQKVQANKTVFAAQDRVLLTDGTVGTVSSITGSKMIVSVGGIEKTVVSSTVKKIVACGSDKKDDKKKTSLKDKISNAIGKVRGSKKKKADIGEETPDIAMEGEVEVMGEAPAPMAQPAGGGETSVSKSEIKAIDFIEGEGYVVNKSENEVISFGEDKDGAQNYVQSMKRKAAIRARVHAKIKAKAGQQQDTIIDSADHATPEGSEAVTKKLKGLDQKGKDYGKTTKEEKVNPDTSMIGRASRRKTKATALTKDAPTDSSSLKKPGGTETIVSKIKGLTQQGKGYKSTKPNEKINPELSVFGKKNKVLSADNKKKTARLKELESSLLVDRAVKVGACTEADRAGQLEIMAELYESGPSEFKAYARLINQMEKNAGKEVGTSRTHKKIANSMVNKHPVIVEASDIMGVDGNGSLDAGDFFNDED